MADLQRLIQQLVVPETRQQAYTALVAVGAPAVEPLIAAFEATPTDFGQSQIASALAAIGDDCAVPALKAWARSSQPKTRQSAVIALGAFGRDSQVPEMLRDIARHDPEFEVRLVAIGATGRAAGKEAAKALWIELLNDPSEQAVATAALNISGAFPGDPVVNEAMMATLRRPDVPRAALGWLIMGLGKSGDSRAFEAIAPFLRSADGQQRAHAADALGKLGDPRAVELLMPLRDDRAYAWEEDHGGPKYSVGDVVKQALDAINRQAKPDDPKPRRRWKLF
ncbi:MAG: HEAT repeat domain-containing protein [Chloroflexi bacterium]|nr:HEAT repeat domain-containing protein [Chloroflexota bacterium]